MTILKIISKQKYLKQNKKPDQKQTWNLIADEWNKYVVKKILIVEDFLKEKKGKIIDLGCGDGRNMIPNPDIIYYGVDFSRSSLNHAKQRAEKENIKAELFHSPAYKLDFKDNFFDYGLFIASLHCIETPLKRKKSLEEFYRVLKPNSQSLISVWNSEDKRFKCVKNHGSVYISWYSQRKPIMRFYYLFKKQEIMYLLKSVGFKILEFYEPIIDDRFSTKNWIIRIKK